MPPAAPEARSPKPEAPPSPLASAALAAGAATRKSTGPEGDERVFSPVHAQRIAKLLATAPPAVLGAIEADLGSIGGPAAPLARALYLKSAAARADTLLGGAEAPREAARTILRAFAGRISGLPAEELLKRSTSIDLDSRVSTSDFEPVAWDEKRGVIHDRGRGDARGDNDGMIQRFTGSCGSTSLGMALAEEDPVRAFAANDAGLQSLDPKDEVSRFQEAVLAEHASAAYPRRVEWNLARLKNGLGRLEAVDRLSKADASALRDHADGKAALTAGARRALTALRGLAGGSPTDAELAEIRATKVREDQGLTTEEMAAAMDRHLAPVTGKKHKVYGPTDEILKKGELTKHVDEMATALERGGDIAFSVTDPPHWMVMTAVRPAAAASGQRAATERSFLMSDPWTGRTAWIAEKDMVSGKFLETPPFELAERGAKGWIDSVILPLERSVP